MILGELSNIFLINIRVLIDDGIERILNNYVILLLIFILSTSAIKGQSSKLINTIEINSGKISKDVRKWRRQLHENPELSNEEKKTSKFVESQLRKFGLKPIRGVAKTGVVAVLEGGKPGPIIAVRADMDALPIEEETGLKFSSKNSGVMHACGHDFHTSILLGVAKILSEAKDEIPGKIKFIFQPAEEAPSGQMVGARLMVKEGVLKNPDVEAIFGLHVDANLEVGSLGYVSGPFMASSDLFRITIRGKRSHGAYPWKGIDAIVVASEVVTSLQNIVSRKIDARKPVVITVGTIHGGDGFNIIADEVTLVGTVRTLDPAAHAKVPTLMEEIIKGITSAHGATYEFDYTNGAPVTVNDPELTAKSIPFLKSTSGIDSVHVNNPTMGAEDFAWFAQEVPGFYFDLGVRNEAEGKIYGVHTALFNPDEDALEIGVRTMSTLLVKYLSNHAK